MNQAVQSKLQDGKFEFWFCRPRKTNGKWQTPEPWMPPELITLKGDKYIVGLHQYPILIVIYILCMLQHLHASLPLIPPLLQLLWISGPSPNFSLTCNFCLLQLKCEQHYRYNKFRPIINIFWLLWSPVPNKGNKHHAALFMRRLDLSYSSQATSILWT